MQNKLRKNLMNLPKSLNLRQLLILLLLTQTNERKDLISLLT